MSRLSLTNNPLLLGFDQVDRLLEHIAKQPGDAYPPFNIETDRRQRLPAFRWPLPGSLPTT